MEKIETSIIGRYKQQVLLQPPHTGAWRANKTIVGWMDNGLSPAFMLAETNAHIAKYEHLAPEVKDEPDLARYVQDALQVLYAFHQEVFREIGGDQSEMVEETLSEESSNAARRSIG